METKYIYAVTAKAYKNGRFGTPYFAEPRADTEANRASLARVTHGYKRWIFDTKEEAVAKFNEIKDAREAVKNTKNEPLRTYPEIKRIVAVLFEMQRESVLKNLQDYYKRMLEAIKGFEGKSSWDSEVRKVVFNPYMRDLSRLWDRVMEVPGKSAYSPNDPMYLKKNHEQIITKMIDSDLNDIMSRFLAKMEHKLGEIIKEKGIKDFKSKGMLEGFVYFEFVDGARFQMSNSIEWGRSKYGVHFQRFPSRFHDVIMADGTRMKSPSEDKMKLEF